MDFVLCYVLLSDESLTMWCYCIIILHRVTQAPGFYIRRYQLVYNNKSTQPLSLFMYMILAITKYGFLEWGLKLLKFENKVHAYVTN